MSSDTNSPSGPWFLNSRARRRVPNARVTRPLWIHIESTHEPRLLSKRRTLFQIEIAADEERFTLYRTYNNFLGTWLQVERLQAQVAVAVEADSSTEEEETRAALRDQAQFVRLELEQAEADLQRNIPALKRPNHLRINQAIRDLLFEVHATVSRLLSEQCIRILCAPSS